MTVSDLKKKYFNLSVSVRAGFWYTVCSFIQKGISFITVPIFTRMLTTEQYGTVSVYYSWQGVIMIFCTLNLFYGVFNNGMVKYEKDRSAFLASMQGLVTTLTLLLFVVYLFMQNILNPIFELNTILMTVMFCDILANAAFLFWSARERFEFRYRTIIAVTLMIAVFCPALAIVAIYFSPKQYVDTVRILAYALVTILICGVIYVRNFVKGKTFYNRKYWRYAIHFNVPLVPHYLSTLLLNQSDRLMISKIVGKSEAGIYSLSHNLAMVLNILTSAINNAFAPWLYNQLKKKEYRKIASVSNGLFLMVAVALGLLIGLAPEVIFLMATKDYYEAIYVIPPLAVSLYFVFMYQIFANVEFYFEENKFIMYASVSGAGLNIVLNYIFIQWFGYLAAGYTTLACYIIFGIAHYVFMKKTAAKYIGEGIALFDIKTVLGISLALIFYASIMLSVYQHLIIRYVLLVVSILWLAKNSKKIMDTFKTIKEI